MRGHADNDRRKKEFNFCCQKSFRDSSFYATTILLWGRKKTGMKNCTPHVQKITTMMKYNKVRMIHTQFRFLLTHITKICLPLLYLKIVAIELLLET